MRHGRSSFPLPAFFVAATLAVSPAAPAGAQAPPPFAAVTADGREAPLATILERAGAYVLRYGESFRNLVAEEAYHQADLESTGASPRRVSNLRSDVVFVPLPGPIPWGTFRDVYNVDGEPVRDRDQRLEQLFAKPGSSSYEQARAILREGARYNLGMNRTVNTPTLGLLFLLPQNQGRLAFKRKGTKTIAGLKAVEVAFEEKARPTLVRNRSDEDVLASGSFWIDPSHGTVLRTRLGYGRGGVTTEFRREPALDIFVPDTMDEWYVFSDGSLEGRARYRNYRRFQVSSDWEVSDTKPGESPQR